MREYHFKDLVDFGFFPLTVIKEADKTGSIWDVRIIEQGWSSNGVFYSAEVLKAAISLFNEDVKVFAFQFNGKEFNHLSDDIVDFHREGFSRNMAGFLSDVKFSETEKGLIGKFNVTDDFFKMTFKNSFKHGKKDLLGFSIDARGRLRFGTAEGRQGKIAEEIKKVNSLDIVTHPAAGGELLRMVASQNIGGFKTMDILIKMIRENPTILGIKESSEIKDKSDEEISVMLMDTLKASTGKEHDAKGNLTDEDISKIKEMLKDNDIDKVMKMLESLTVKKEDEEEENNDDSSDDNSDNDNQDDNSDNDNSDDNADDSNSDDNADDPVKESVKKADEVISRLEQRESDLIIKEALADETILPQESKDMIKESFNGKMATKEEVDEAIKTHKEYLGKIAESKLVNDMSEESVRVTTGLDAQSRLQIAMHKMLGIDPTDEEKEDWKKVPAFRGIKEAYIKFTGDSEVLSDNQGVMQEAIVSDFPQALGTSMERRLLKEYARLDINAAWRKFASIESVDNFKTQDRIQIGGLADLPVVAENGAYTEFTSPSEVKASYAVTKKGKILPVTWEFIKNDDLRVVTRLVSEMGKSAARTLGKFVFDLILNVSGGVINAGTIYDSKALYHADHSNTTTDAMDFDAIDAAITAIANQEQPDSAEPLNINAKFLLVPYEKRSAAKIFIESEDKPSSTGDGTIRSINPNFQALEPVIIPNGYLRSDQNNWYVLADPADLEYLNIGFLDGKQNPEMFVQDQPTVGKVFTNDQIRYKVRHVYSGVVTDFRGFYGGLEAGLS